MEHRTRSRLAREDLERMIEMIPVAVLRLDGSRQIFTANAAQELLGDSVAGKNADEVYGQGSGQSSLNLRSIKTALVKSPDNYQLNVTASARLADVSSQDMLCSFVLNSNTDRVDSVIVVPGVVELHRAFARVAESIVETTRLAHS